MLAGSAISRRQFLAASAEIGLGVAAWASPSGSVVAQPVLGAN